MFEIKTPQINANDTIYLINEIFFENGDYVENGDVIASIGSSKTVNDLESEFSGYIYFTKKPLDEIEAGESFAFCFETKEEYEKYSANLNNTSKEQEAKSYVLTKPAQKFALENNIEEAQILTLNKTIIKTEDLQELLSRLEEAKKEQNNNDLIKNLPYNQIQSANVVIKSHREIPQAFHLIKADCTKCEEFIKEYIEKTGLIIGYGEITTVILSELFSEFPLMFSKYVKENKVCYAAHPIIGITMDTGGGLFMPSISCEDDISLDEAAEIMFDYKMKSVDNSFEAQDLKEGNISISYNPKKNIISVVPIVFPNQSAMVSVCSPSKELGFDENKNIIEKSYLYIGLAFDHRVINGSSAMEFLSRISEKIEKLDFRVVKKAGYLCK